MGQEGLRAWFRGVWHGVWAGFRIMSDKASLSDIATITTSRADSVATQRDKPPRKNSSCPGDSRRSRPPRRTASGRSGAPFGAASAGAPNKATLNENPGTASPSATGADPGLGAGERKGRGGRVRCLPPAPGSRLLDAFLRADPPAAGALRSRLALQSAAASAKILRLNADEAALRDLRFAVGDPRGPAANLLSLWRDGAERPPSLDPEPDRRRSGAAGPGCGPERPRSEPEGLRRGGRSGFGGRKGRRPGVLRPPGRPSGPIRDFGALGVRYASSPFGCAGRGPFR